jgi:hypothetical protein
MNEEFEKVLTIQSLFASPHGEDVDALPSPGVNPLEGSPM